MKEETNWCRYCGCHKDNKVICSAGRHSYTATREETDNNFARPILWSERIGNELYIYRAGVLIYKRWFKKNSTEKRQPSVIFNSNGWPNVEII